MEKQLKELQKSAASFKIPNKFRKKDNSAVEILLRNHPKC